MDEPNSVTNEIQNHKKEFHVDKYKPNSEEKKVITKVIAVGEQFKPLHQKLGELFTPEVRHTIAALKLQTFKVTKGDEGQLVELSVNKALMWKDFVQTYFGVTASTSCSTPKKSKPSVPLYVRRSNHLLRKLQRQLPTKKKTVSSWVWW